MSYLRRKSFQFTAVLVPTHSRPRALHGEIKGCGRRGAVVLSDTRIGPRGEDRDHPVQGWKAVFKVWYSIHLF